MLVQSSCVLPLDFSVILHTCSRGCLKGDVEAEGSLEVDGVRFRRICNEESLRFILKMLAMGRGNSLEEADRGYIGFRCSLHARQSDSIRTARNFSVTLPLKTVLCS